VRRCCIRERVVLYVPRRGNNADHSSANFELKRSDNAPLADARPVNKPDT